MITARTEAAGAEIGRAFRAELAAVNLQRLFWLLIAGLAARVVLLLVNHYAAASSDVLASMYWFDVLVIPPLIWLTWRLRRPGASVRAGWMLILFVTWGTLGMGVIQAVTSASDMGYRAVYVFMLLIVAVGYVLPPRLILPVYGIVHAAYVAILLGGDFDAKFRLASLTDGTLGVIFAAGVSWLLHQAKWQDFLKERTIAAQNRELVRRNGEMQDLMAVAAHDLRSPLQGLDNVLEIAGALADPAAGRLRQALGEGRESCRRMLSLVTRLLDAHAAEHSHDAAAQCDARAVFAAAARNHHTAALARAVVLRTILPDNAAPVGMDATALTQVLDNLIGNALKFSPRGTTVELALCLDGETWLGEVRDEGPGMPADEQAEMFGKFRRGTNAPRQAEAGFGLGLFIVRQLLKSAGGDAGYADRQPHGAVFRITLPRARP